MNKLPLDISFERPDLPPHFDCSKITAIQLISGSVSDAPKMLLFFDLEPKHVENLADFLRLEAIYSKTSECPRYEAIFSHNEQSVIVQGNLNHAINALNERFILAQEHVDAIRSNTDAKNLLLEANAWQISVQGTLIKSEEYKNNMQNTTTEPRLSQLSMFNAHSAPSVDSKNHQPSDPLRLECF